MKVKLSLGNSDFVGYKNVNPFTELTELHNNSALEIYCDQEVLSKIANKEFPNFMNALVSKLRKGGSLIISGPDCGHAFMAYLHRTIDEEKLSELIQECRGYYNCRYIEDALRKLGIKIDSMSISNYYFHVKGTRE